MTILDLLICGFWVLVGLFVMLIGRQATDWLTRRYKDAAANRVISGGINVACTAIGAIIVVVALYIAWIVLVHS